MEISKDEVHDILEHELTIEIIFFYNKYTLTKIQMDREVSQQYSAYRNKIS